MSQLYLQEGWAKYAPLQEESGNIRGTRRERLSGNNGCRWRADINGGRYER